MDIVVGTYDEIILGYRVVNVGEKLQLEASFTDRSHAGSVRCVAISPKGVLASGGSDETIRLLNLKKERELGSLVHHNGTITSLEFYKGFLFSSSEDHKMCIWKSSSWECLRTLKGHKAGINCLSVHPSGKMALSVGRDKTLHTWNLITARTAFISNIKQVADLVKWSPDGDTYLTVTNNKIEVYSVETADVSLTIQAEGRINCVEFLDSTTCVYGGEGGKVMFHDLKDNQQLHTCDTGTVRIKGLCLSPSPLEEQEKVLTIASSDGYIKMYRIESNQQDNISTELLLEQSTSFRITCMAVYSLKGADTVSTDMAPADTTQPSTQQVEKKIKKRTRSKSAITGNSTDDKEDEVSDDAVVQEETVKHVKQKMSKKAKLHNANKTEKTTKLSSLTEVSVPQEKSIGQTNKKRKRNT